MIKIYSVIAVLLAGLLLFMHLKGAELLAVSYTSESAITEAGAPVVSAETETLKPVIDARPVTQHVPIPEQVKAIYMSSCVAGTPSFRDRLVRFIEETEVNSVVLDIKDYSGTIAFPPQGDAWKPAWQASGCGARDMRAFIESMHEKDIFVIGRITVFQDPFYTKTRPDLAVKKADGQTVWKDYKGLSFIDVGAKEYWDHAVELAVESYNIGYDEINFDYIRYPSDGPMNDISFTHAGASEHGADYQANLEAFFVYLHEKMNDETLFADYRHENTGREKSIPWTSADLFGMTTTNYDDLTIGQVQDRAAPYFDFIAPMVYPSHYPDSFLGLGDPNLYPYKVVHYAMKSGVDRMKASTTPMQGFQHEPIYTTNASGTKRFTGLYKKQSYGGDKFRTWIQDFDYGGDYDAADVRAQIKASYDAGVDSWMVWAPSNVYTRGAYKLASSTPQ